MIVQFTAEENVIIARSLSENAVYLCTVYALNSVGSVSTGDALRICKCRVRSGDHDSELAYVSVSRDFFRRGICKP